MSHPAAPLPAPLLLRTGPSPTRAAGAGGSAERAAGGRPGPHLSLAHVGIALVALSGLALGQGAWMIGSARLGEAVAERAWTQARGQANGAEPRLAAGGSAVARLRVPALGIDEIVVAGEEAELERGPRLVAGSLAAGVGGHAVVAGHRDLHFRFLRDLRPGDELLLASPDGWQRRYRVVGVEVLEGADPRLAETGSAPALTLLTHYPFDAVPPGGPLRYAVHAVASGG